ncbi:MAG: tetratricopeptide repeat protein, partial [Spirulina sp.]
MDEQRVRAYLDLIQELLSCPEGEENAILDRHRELIDADFLRVCQQMAEQLQGEGRENEAGFLRDLAQQLAEYLHNSTPTNDRRGAMLAPNTPTNATPEEYFRFLMAVLQATSESKGDPSVVYPLLQQNLAKLDVNFARILQTWASHTLSEIEEERAFSIAADIGNFANLIQQFPLGSRADNLEIGIAGYEIISTVFTQEKALQIWATLQNNLGNAYRNRIRGERGENLEWAIACFQAALQVYTPDAFPEKWAMTQNNLGNAYNNRIRGERGENLEWAIACYQAALQVRTPDAFPEDWAMTQNNLGTAYNNRIRGERGENLEKAIAAYEAALDVYTRAAFPQQWAMTQNNLGTAYLYRIRGE